MSLKKPETDVLVRLSPDQHNHIVTLCGASPDLLAALGATKAAIPADEETISRARELYAIGSDDNVEIDDEALTSESDEGVWVQAWVWLRHPDTDGDDEGVDD